MTDTTDSPFKFPCACLKNRVVCYDLCVIGWIMPYACTRIRIVLYSTRWRSWLKRDFFSYLIGLTYTWHKKVPWRFLKPVMCKYPTTVNISEIYILLLKPCSLMWHLVRGYRVRNCRDTRPETGWMRSPKVAHLKIPMDSVLYNTEHCGINDDMNDEHSI